MYDGACEGASDPFNGLDLRHDQLAQLVDIAGLGPHDHVIGAGDIFGIDHTIDVDDLAGYVGSLADFSLDQNIGLNDHEHSPALLVEYAVQPTRPDRLCGTPFGRQEMIASTLAELGEFELIDLLSQIFPQGEHVFLGPGDDAALVRTPRGHVVVAADMSVQGRHFKTEWAPARSIGRKATAANLSDINAMGGRAHSLTVSLGMPPESETKWILELASGIAEEAALVGASVVGGDVTRSDEVIIAISVLGTCDQAPVRRNGAQPGDVLALAGRQGWAAAGLAVLQRGFNSPRALVEAYQCPQVPYWAGPAAAQAGATAMLDVSDGLVADARHIAKSSGVDLEIQTDNLAVAEPMQAVSAAIGSDPIDFILSGGDDYCLLATFPAQAARPEGFTVIGSVVEMAGEHPEVRVDEVAYEGTGGHRHF